MKPQLITILHDGKQYGGKDFVEKFANDEQRVTGTFRNWPMFMVVAIATRIGALIVDRDTIEVVAPSHENCLIPPWIK